ncbi:hypothetical protein ATCC90586_004032 [Pythium insidiosum]|nr:hypothetical protein ATCC90586_004032 [Pythium insidiosum]
MLYEFIGALEVTYGNALAGGGGFRRVTTADGSAAEVTAATYLWFKLTAPTAAAATEPARASSRKAAAPQAVMALQIAGARDRPRDRDELAALQGSWVRLDKALDRQRGLFLWFFLANWQPPRRAATAAAAPSSSSSSAARQEEQCDENESSSDDLANAVRPLKEIRVVRDLKDLPDGFEALEQPLVWEAAGASGQAATKATSFLCIRRLTAEEIVGSQWSITEQKAGVWVDLRDLASNKWYVAQIVHLSATECRVQVHTWRKSREELVSLTTSRNRFARLGTQTLIYVSPAYPYCRKHGAQLTVAVKDVERARHDFDASFFDEAKQAVYLRQRLVPLVERLLLCTFSSNDVVEEVNAFLQHVIKGVVAWFLRQKVTRKSAEARDADKGDKRTDDIALRLLSLLRMILSGMSTGMYYYLKYGDLKGIDTLYEIALSASSEDVSQAAINYVVHLYMNLGSKLLELLERFALSTQQVPAAEREGAGEGLGAVNAWRMGQSQPLLQNDLRRVKGLTAIFIDKIMNGIEVEDADDVKPYFRSLNTLFKQRDSLAEERVNDGMTKLLAVMASQQRYFKATEISIDMLARLGKRHASVIRWLHANEGSCTWLEKWLLGHRGPSGYLQQKKTSLVKPNSTSSWGQLSVNSDGFVRSVERIVAKLLPRVRNLLDPSSAPEMFYDSDDNPTRLVGKRVRVKWAKEKWYEGVVERFDEATYEHFVVYDDGDKRNYRMSDKVFYVVEQQPSPSRESSSQRRRGS